MVTAELVCIFQDLGEREVLLLGRVDLDRGFARAGENLGSGYSKTEDVCGVGYKRSVDSGQHRRPRHRRLTIVDCVLGEILFRLSSCVSTSTQLIGVVVPTIVTSAKYAN